MPLIATANGSNAERKLCPAGNHIARCVSVVDLGTQVDDGQFGKKVARKVRLAWELPDELEVFNEEKGEEPFVIGKKYTLSLHEKAGLRKDLEAWRGRPFTEDELKGFDIETLLGVPCMLNVVHKRSDNGKTYANIAGVTPLPKKVKAGQQILEPTFYSLDMGREGAFKKLPEWMQNEIAKCQEWNTQGPDDRASNPANDGADLDPDAEEDVPF